MTTLTISDLGEDGEGIAQGEGEIVDERGTRRELYIVPSGIVGDVITVRKAEPRGRTLRVSAFDLITPSPARSVAFCRHQSCGGCALREWSLAGAALAKQQRLHKALSRAGVETADSVLVSDGLLGYRHRVRLHAGGRRIGYRRARSHEILPLSDCPVLEPPFAEALQKAITTLAKTGVCFGEIDAVFGEGRLALQLNVERLRPEAPMFDACRDLISQRLAAGVIVTAAKKSRRMGEPQIVRAHPCFSTPPRFALEPGVFSQANWAMNARLIDAVLEAVPADAKVTELHAGAGNFTLPLASRQSVWASEISEAAIMCARRNAETHGVSATLVVCEDKEALARAPAADVLLIDPPRVGAKAVAEQLAASPSFSRIVYVSCDPGSFARDARILAPRYRLLQLMAFDMFPGTPHVEALGVFVKV